MTARAKKRNQGKGMFIKEVLNSNPEASHPEIVAAWQAEGMSGGISATLVSRMRSRLGLVGQRGRRSRPSPADADAGATASAPAAPARGARARAHSLMELEVEIDRLMMKVAMTGTLPEVEDALRKTRRQLYAAQG